MNTFKLEIISTKNHLKVEINLIMKMNLHQKEAWFWVRNPKFENFYWSLETKMFTSRWGHDNICYSL